MPRAHRPGSTELLRVVHGAGIRDERVLEAAARVPRVEFVPPEAAAGAYFDEPIPIGRGQVTTQPSLVARMVEALSLRGGEHVLEIRHRPWLADGLLATLAKRVWSVERFPDLAEAARRNLAGRHRERGSRGRRRRPGARRRPLRRDRGLRGLAGGAVAADGAACGPRSPGPSARHRWRRAGDPVREAIGRGARGALSPEPAS